jgi:Sulfotransferase family
MSSNSEPHGDPRRFFFVHVQKAAGTELKALLKQNLGARAVYPDDTDGNVFTEGPQISVEILLDRWQTRREEIRVVTGHFPFCTVELLDADFTVLTALRHPVERTLSYIRHFRKTEPGAEYLPLEVIYEDPARFERMVKNHMVKMFGLTVEEMEMTGAILTEVEFTPEHLERAKRNLAAVDVVGLQERFDDFCDELERRFGWSLKERYHAQRTEPVEVPDSLRRRIAEDNALDMELYEFARRLVAERS